MTLHIRDAVTGPVVLRQNSKQLTVISNTGTVTSTSSGADGIDGPATNPWPIENDGTVTSASGVGISLAAGGTVDNAPRALIAGYISGVLIDGTSAAVTNAGAITGNAPRTVNPVVSGTVLGDGIALFAGGSVTNFAGGAISGSLGFIGPSDSDSAGSGVFIAGAPGNVSNAGTISGSAYGIALDAGGTVTNTSSILGAEDGVKVKGGTASVANSGSIRATRDDGIGLFNGGSVSNRAGGFISGGTANSAAGIYVGGGIGNVTNAGSIASPNNIGIAFFLGGGVTNNAGASISGGASGVFIRGGSGAVTNAGDISTTGTNLAGVYFQSGGAVTNNSGGSISGKAFGVFITGAPGTVENAGIISGGTYSVRFAGPGTNLLKVDPGAVFNGPVGGSFAPGASNRLELASGAGSIGGIGNGSFINFQNLTVDAGGNWILDGANTVPTVLNDGTVEITGSLDVTTAIDPASTGLFKLDKGATLEVAKALGTQTQISFLGSNTELVIDDFGSFGTGVGTTGPLLENFGTDNDMIDLKNFGFSSTLQHTFTDGLLQLSNNPQAAAYLAFQTSTLGNENFAFSQDLAGTGTLIKLSTPV